MISDVKRAKFTKLFHLMDRDNNQFITKSDFLSSADQLIQALNIPNDSAMAEQMRAGRIIDWEELTSADVNNDGQVSLDEWLDYYYQRSIDSELIETKTIERSKRMLQILGDSDGKLSMVQWKLYFEAVGFPEEEYALSFNKLDVNGDGYLSTDEVLKASIDFYTSDDPDAPGNYMCGDYTSYLSS